MQRLQHRQASATTRHQRQATTPPRTRHSATIIIRCEPFFLSCTFTYRTSSVILRGIARVECLSSSIGECVSLESLALAKEKESSLKSKKIKKKKREKKRIKWCQVSSLVSCDKAKTAKVSVSVNSCANPLPTKSN